MELLIIPLFLAGGAFFLNRSEKENERKTAEERAKLEREIATDRQQEAALQSYLDRMAELLLEDNLLTTDNEAVRLVAQTRTLTVLRGLDGLRKRNVLQFLRDAKLIGAMVKSPVFTLKGADLSNADLRGANLQNADLSRSSFIKTDLSNANMRNVFFKDTNVTDAILQFADLNGATVLPPQTLEFVKTLKGAIMPDGKIHY